MRGLCPFAEYIPGVMTQGPIMADHVGFCDHAAGGFMSTMRRAEFWNGQGVSAHFAVGRDGAIIQLVNIFDQAWAQGRLGPTVTWPPFNEMGRRNPNQYLISVEHEDWFIDNTGKARAVPGSEWTPLQYQSDLRLKNWCAIEVERETGRDMFRFGLDSLAGHHMFDGVNRANCPGTYWRNEYRQRLDNDLNPQEGDMSNLNGDGSQRIVSNGPFIEVWNGAVPVIRYGSSDGQYPGRISKNFGGQWLWLRGLDDNNPPNLVPLQWSAVEGD